MRRAPFPLLTLLLSLSAASPASADPAFPLKISGNKRYLVDSADKPFFYQADTAWMLFLKLTEPEAVEYMENRKKSGFTVIQVILTGFLGNKDLDGKLPFAGTPPEQHLDQPNEAFFQKVDRLTEKAEKMGLVLAIAPAWSGCCGEGWAGKEKDGADKPLNRNGAAKCLAFGEWLGKRYAARKNLVWILGGDMDPHNARDEIRAMGLGLKAGAPPHLLTYHASSSHSSTDVWPADESWLDVSMVYTYFRGFNKAWNKDQPDVYEVSHLEYVKSPVRPFFLGESTYEGEHDAWGSALQARKQAWWCVLGGGCGHAYGSPNWHLSPDWRRVMELPGAASLAHVRALMESRPWWTLVPDLKNQTLTDGFKPLAQNNAAVCAVTEDRACAIAYLPDQRTVTLNTSSLAGPELAASWMNAATGAVTSAGNFKEKGAREFRPPGEGDWVLVVDDVSRNFLPPAAR